MRVKVLHITVVCLLFIPIIGLVNIQFFQGSFYYDLSKKNYIRLIPQEASRGKIYDRNGIVLVDNIPSFDVAIVPQELREKNRVLSQLSIILKKDKEELLNNYRKAYAAPFSPAIIAKDISKDKAIILEEQRTSLPGIMIQIRPKRFYPYDKMYAHVIGYLGLIDRSTITRLKDYGYKIKDTVGYTGVEEYYDRYIRGEDGGIQVEVDHKGRQKRMLGRKAAKEGKDLTLTIDMRIQQAVYEALDKHKGTVVVMDAYNGEIVAMASWPSFNSNAFVQGEPNLQVKQLLNDTNAPLLNRAISGKYPPGSTFKFVEALAGLETKKISTKTSFFCPGVFKIGNARFKCWSEHGNQDLKDAIVHSCNVFFYRLGLLLGPKLLYQYASEFGLGRPTGIDLPYESRGNVANPDRVGLLRKKKWYKGDTANFAIGQGELLVTPIQMVRAMAAVVNGGKLVTPHLIKAIEGQDPPKIKSSSQINLNKENIKLLRSYLRRVVAEPSGTAYILDISKLTVAGKTGTAQAGRRRSHAWFVGFFPFESSRFAFCVVLEHGGSSYNACLVARKFLKRLIREKILN